MSDWDATHSVAPAITAGLHLEMPTGKHFSKAFAKRDADNSDHGNFPGANGAVVYAEDLLVGYRHFDTHHIVPEFPFGHGLSYTRFAYRNLVIERPTPEGRVSLEPTIGASNPVVLRFVLAAPRVTFARARASTCLSFTQSHLRTESARGGLSLPDSSRRTMVADRVKNVCGSSIVSLGSSCRSALPVGR